MICIGLPIYINVQLYFVAKMNTICIIHKGNRKNIFKTSTPPPRVPTNPFARKRILISDIIYVKSYLGLGRGGGGAGGADIPQPKM